jgi:hypothetical protein
MAVTTAKTLAHAQLGSSAGTLYTVPSATKAIVRHIRVVNPDTASHTFDLYRNGSGDANRLTETVTVPAGGSWEDDVFIGLETVGDTIQGKADTATKLTIYIGGAEIA